jgi:hypothetical protein
MKAEQESPKATAPQVALIEYSREIGPRIRDIEKKKQIIKDFKETDEHAQELKQEISNLQEQLKAYVEEQNKDVIDEIKTMESELKSAIKGAARSTKDSPRPYKAGELKPYFVARNKPVPQGKPTPVKKVIVKGDTFEELEAELGSE